MAVKAPKINYYNEGYTRHIAYKAYGLLGFWVLGFRVATIGEPYSILYVTLYNPYIICCHFLDWSRL